METLLVAIAAAVAVPLVVGTIARFGIVLGVDRSWFVGAGPYRSTEYVEERPLWPESVARPFRSVDSWLGRYPTQFVFRWSAVVMFLALGIIGAVQYFTGSAPQTTFSTYHVTGGPVPLLSLPRYVGVATLPFWVWAAFITVRLITGKGHAGASTRAFAAFRGASLGVSEAAAVLAGFIIVGLVPAVVGCFIELDFPMLSLAAGIAVPAIGGVLAFLVTLMNLIIGMELDLRTALGRGTRHGIHLSLPLILASFLPFGFTHGLLYAFVLALLALWGLVCVVGLAVIAAFACVWLYELIRRWLGRLYRLVGLGFWYASMNAALAVDRMWGWLAVKDIPEEPTDRNDTASSD